MKTKFFTILLGIVLIWGGFVHLVYAGSSLWRPTSGKLTPVVGSWELDINSTASSTFAGGIEIENEGIKVTDLVSCDTIDTDANGFLVCGSDETGIGGGAFAWTPDTTYGENANSTSTPIWFKDTLYASSTSFFTGDATFIDLISTNSTTTSATTTNMAVSGFSQLGTVISGIWNGTALTDTYVSDALTISSSGNIDKGALQNSGTLGFDWVDGEIANTLTVDWTGLQSYPTGCTNQFVRTIGDTLTCSTVDLSADTNLTVSSPLTITGDDLGFSFATANDWTGLNTFLNASSTWFSVTDTAYFGGSATSTFSSTGELALAVDLAVAYGGTGASSLNDLIALTTHTTGNYTATVADAGNSTITVVNGTAEGGAVTLDAVDLNCTNCIGATEISDVYLMNNANDTTTGQLTALNFVASGASATSTFVGGLTVDTSDFVVDPDGGLVGIGTTSPWGKLSVEMDTTNPTFVVANNGSSSPAFYIGGVNENGNVGIGTNPDELLHISAGTSGDAVLKIEADTDNNDEGDNPRIEFFMDGNVIEGKIGLEGVSGVAFTNSIAGFQYMEGLAGIQFATNGVERMTIRDDGDIGMAGCFNSDHDLKIGGTGTNCDTGTWSEIDAGESSFTVSSSQNLKENFVILPKTGILQAIANTSVYNYNFKESAFGGRSTTTRKKMAKQKRIGLVAEEFYANLNPYTNRGEPTSLSGDNVVYSLWLGVQELTRENQELKARVRKLER